MNYTLRATLILLALPALAWAQAQDGGQSMDQALFGGDAPASQGTAEVPEAPEVPEPPAVPAANGTTLDTMLLTQKATEIGGTLTSKLTGGYGWTGMYPALSNLDSGASSFAIDLSMVLYIDARPDKDFRVFAKTELSYPFQNGPASSSPDFQIHELFADFNYKEALFFRAGKQAIKSGVGYFYSPADFLSLSAIDPTDPVAERDGPVALKVQYPFGDNNLYAYVIAKGATTLSGLGYVIRGEFVFGSNEFGAEGYVEPGKAPRAALTWSGPLFGVDFFAEGTASYGSDRRFLAADASSLNPPGYAVQTYPTAIVLSGTAGLMYSDQNSGLSIEFQYFYNGDGYTDPSIVINNYGVVSALLAAGRLYAEDLISVGQHYGAARIGWAPTDSHFSAYALWLSDFSEGSGRIEPAIVWTPLDHASLTLSLPVTYGPLYGDYSPSGKGVTVQLSASLGYGSF